MNPITHPAALPQADASSLVDRTVLERHIQDLYRDVAANPHAARHFETGRALALELGYPASLLACVPDAALASFAGVGWHLDMALLRPGDRVLDLGSGSGTDAFCAAACVTDERARRRRRLHRRPARPGPARGRAPRHPHRGAGRGQHRRAAVRRRELRRRHLERRHQPVPRQAPGVRRGGAGAEARRAPGRGRHRRPTARCARPRGATRSCGRRASPARSPSPTTSTRWSPPASASPPRGATSTASSASGPRRRRALRRVQHQPVRGADPLNEGIDHG